MRRENDQMDYFFSFSETRFAVHISLTFLISVIDIDCEFTLTFLLGLVVCLTKYFATSPNIPTDDVVKFILENREINTKESIRHKPNKNV